MEEGSQFNIISSMDIYRNKLENIEKSININDKRYYDIYTNKIDDSSDKLSLIETIYMDSYVLLCYKKSINFITEEEQKIYNKVIVAFSNGRISLFTSFFTNESMRNGIINEASIFRKQNKLSKAKMYYLLKTVDVGILDAMGYKIKSELKKYDLSINDLILYIHSCNNTHDITSQLLDYLNFLFVHNLTRYNQVVFYIRKKNETLFEDKNDRISEDEISYFISKLLLRKNKAKIYCITKKIGD